MPITQSLSQPLAQSLSLSRMHPVHLLAEGDRQSGLLRMIWRGSAIASSHFRESSVQKDLRAPLRRLEPQADFLRGPRAWLSPMHMRALI